MKAEHLMTAINVLEKHLASVKIEIRLMDLQLDTVNITITVSEVNELLEKIEDESRESAARKVE